ncbi:MAG: TetR/AcrR family transcriptional regulator [Pseudomonadota bacterium]
MVQAARPSRDLREDCVTEALSIIEERGVEHLSLREVARRLGVSHQAPYKHYANRDALLAEVVSRAYQDFAAHLDARTHHEDPHSDLAELGQAYLGYAGKNPLAYRLMFGTPLPDAEQHPEMMREARHAFAILRDCIVRIQEPKASKKAVSPDLDALFVWALVHGKASIQQTDALNTLGLSEEVLADFETHVGQRLMAALDAKI